MEQLGVIEIGGMIIVFAFIAWLVVFFQVVRPRIMARAGRRIGVGVHESVGLLDTGGYSADDSAPLQKSLAVVVADFATTMLGTVGMAAAVFIPAFLIGESGAPFRWEGMLTNTRMAIADVAIPPLRDGTAQARMRVLNQGTRDQRQCQVAVDGYTPRNGYLNGHSALFDIAAGAEQAVQFEVSTLRSAPGRHTFRLELECANRTKEKIVHTIEVID